MNAPAKLQRCACGDDTGACGGEHVTVATGPLVIMAHGLMAIDPDQRAGFSITSAVGEFTAQDTAELLRQWRSPGVPT